MALKEFRTYRRRDVTRKSGFKASGTTTGAECKVRFSKRLKVLNAGTELVYKFNNLELIKLFKSDRSLLAYGIYVYPEETVSIIYELSYILKGVSNNNKFSEKELTQETWNSCGFYEFIKSNEASITNVLLKVLIKPKNAGDCWVDICCDHFGIVNYEYYIENDVYDEFLKKTNLNIPHIFYFDNEDNFLSQLDNERDLKIEDGVVVVLKSCNRCMRFLPINIDDERKTLAFSNHCVKRAPCTHASFRNYKVVDTEVEDYERIDKNNEIVTYYGHQLECKACKKFYVNAPLNPQRNAEQFKEDGLRRRAFEVLVNNLLDRDLVHHEFKKKTKKEFTEYIYNKFDGKCFKCGKALTEKEMNLDHTMPLAFLYRLDETATCLCDTHNSSKNDRFPCDFYSKDELIRLSKITGIPLDVISSKSVNLEVVEKLKEHVVWFFDEFLAESDYQKIRKGILTSDKIYKALVKVLPKDLDLVEEYRKIKNCDPKTITIK